MTAQEKSKPTANKKNDASTIGLYVLAIATACLGILRALGRTSIDLEVLWFLVAAAMILLFDRVREFNFSKDGISAKLAEIDKKVDEVELIAMDAAQAKLQTEEVESKDETTAKPGTVRAAPAKQRPLELPPVTHQDDPQKGRFGSQASRNGRLLSAKVIESRYSERYFEVELRVAATEDATNPLAGDVTFYLHDTFPNAVQTVKAERNVAVLKLLSYGAFTVGAVCDGGNTQLELDLALDSSFPKRFRDA